jgi:hypothetical protein
VTNALKYSTNRSNTRKENKTSEFIHVHIKIINAMTLDTSNLKIKVLFNWAQRGDEWEVEYEVNGEEKMLRMNTDEIAKWLLKFDFINSIEGDYVHHSDGVELIGDYMGYTSTLEAQLFLEAYERHIMQQRWREKDMQAMREKYNLHVEPRMAGILERGAC